jgi:glutaminyl-peptide cyclotransferase
VLLACLTFFKKMMRILSFLIAITAVGFLTSCKSDKEKKVAENKSLHQVNVPAFNSDSAYAFIKKQVDMGPRVPNTSSHKKAGDYLVAKLKEYGAVVVEQNFEATTFDGKRLNLRNIIASYYPEKEKRILLAAHWDTRPFADKDPEKKDAAFDGANDGASGVGIVLEVARLLKFNQPDVGVDLILFDGEDWGEKDGMQNSVPLADGLDSWWCLGSQYWSKNKHKKNYSAYYGILLDMVGGKRSHFYRDEVSQNFAPRIVENVWNTAARLGFSDYFVKQNVGGITDDHTYLNTVAKIPTVDIVDYRPGIGFFGDYHHTKKDNLELISKETLRAVGITVINVIYLEPAL